MAAPGYLGESDNVKFLFITVMVQDSRPRSPRHLWEKLGLHVSSIARREAPAEWRWGEGEFLLFSYKLSWVIYYWGWEGRWRKTDRACASGFKHIKINPPARVQMFNVEFLTRALHPGSGFGCFVAATWEGSFVLPICFWPSPHRFLLLVRSGVWLVPVAWHCVSTSSP